MNSAASCSDSAARASAATSAGVARAPDRLPLDGGYWIANQPVDPLSASKDAVE